MVTSSTDIINVVTLTVVPLPTLVGGAGVTCTMAQNPNYVYAGTNQSTAAVGVNKTTFSVSTVGLVFGTVVAITADSYGYVSILQNNGGVPQFTIYGPDGQPREDGGGSWFMINPIDAVLPSNYAF